MRAKSVSPLVDGKTAAPGALDRPLNITIFGDTRAQTKREFPRSMRQLAERVSKRNAPTKAKLKLLKLGTFGNVKTDRGSLRHNANMLTIEGIEGDYDGEYMSIAEAEQRIRTAGLAAVIYTSPSHQSDKPRYRVLFPTSQPLPPVEHERLIARGNGVLGGALSVESFALSQSYYYGTAKRIKDKDGTWRDGVPVEITLVEGRAIDLADDLEATPLDKHGMPYGRTPPANDDDEDCLSDISAEPDMERIQLALRTIPASAIEPYHNWLPIGQALHHEFDGNDEGLVLWHEVSQQCVNYDADELERKWESFGRYRGKPVTIATLYHLAKPHAPTTPNIARLNKHHALVMIQGKALIATERSVGGTDFGTVRDLHALYANDRVQVTDKRSEAISEKWMRHPDRRTYPNGVEFAPGSTTNGTLNLWRGWAVESNPDASCEYFLKHVRQIVCGDNSDYFAYVIGWLAHLVQHPDEKPGVALVLRGSKGVGKDSVGDYLARMIGRCHAPTVSQSEHIVGRFNRRMENALLLHVQEGSWAGDHKAEEVLKYIVTSEFVEIERKGIDSINMRSVLRLFISANAEWVVPASRDERRWAVFELSDARKSDERYWKAFRAEMEGEGPAALLDYLQSYDLSGFNVRKAPQTEGLRKQKLASLRGIRKWWFEMLSSGEISICEDDKSWEIEWLTVTCEDLRGAYAGYMRGRRYDGETVDDQTFGKYLKEMLPGIDRKRRGGRNDRIWVYKLPSLPAAREAFATWLGEPLDWDEKL